MRWTFLDYCLLAVVVLGVLLAVQPAAKGWDCLYGTCAPVKIYAVKGMNYAYYEFDLLDCRSCRIANGICTEGPWGSTCLKGTQNQRERALSEETGLVCTCQNNGDFCEAVNAATQNPGPWLDVDKQKICTDI
jgi:hypothetical protein